MAKILIICLSYSLQLSSLAYPLLFISDYMILSHRAPEEVSILLVRPRISKSRQQVYSDSSCVSQILFRGLSTEQVCNKSFFRLTGHLACFVHTLTSFDQGSPSGKVFPLPFR